MAERHALEDLIFVTFMHNGCASQIATALRTFGLQQMALAGAGAQNLPGGGNFKPLGYCLSRLDTFWSSHKIKLSS